MRQRRDISGVSSPFCNNWSQIPRTRGQKMRNFEIFMWNLQIFLGSCKREDIASSTGVKPGVVTGMLPYTSCSVLTLNIYDQSLNLRVGRTAAEMEEIWDGVFLCCKHHRLAQPFPSWEHVYPPMGQMSRYSTYNWRAMFLSESQASGMEWDIVVSLQFEGSGNTFCLSSASLMLVRQKHIRCLGLIQWR